MRVIKTPAAMQRQALQWKRAGTTIAFVPTMGALHAGHLSLLAQARRRAGLNGILVASIYVNPTQFAPTEDLAAYPRDLQRDLRLCREAGVDVVFTPADAQMYAGRDIGGYSTYVVEDRLARVLEGAARPTHFRGVATVVAKLFHLVLPDVALFGAKDWQQAAVIRRMVKDLNFPLRIVTVPTFREPDGLAMSSRNVYLTPEERAQATVLHRIIQLARRTVRAAAAPLPVARLRRVVEKELASAPLGRLDYVEFFDPETLEPVTRIGRGAHLALAVQFGRARLIDNGRL